MKIPTYNQRNKARLAHKVTHHHERGLMWSSCECGWESRKLDSYHNFQLTQSKRDGEDHQSRQMSLAWKE
jgi:hypothetical protein